MKMSIITGVLAMAFAVSSVAQAQTKTPGVTKRQAKQSVRINNGVQNGSLTLAEALRLRAGERDIRQDKRLAKADGKVTLAERANIQHEQNQVSRAIYRKKHNARTRRY